MPGFPEQATRAYEAFLDEPNEGSYVGFINANRKVALGREIPNDAIGILVQVRALEVQSLHAKSTGNLNLAVGVVDRAGAHRIRDHAGHRTRRRLGVAHGVAAQRRAGALDRYLPQPGQRRKLLRS